MPRVPDATTPVECHGDSGAGRAYAFPMLSAVQSEQIRILQAHGMLTTPRISQILGHRADVLRWVAEHWDGSATGADDREVQQVAAEALALVDGTRPLDEDE